jgi:hypothetical protein
VPFRLEVPNCSAALPDPVSTIPPPCPSAQETREAAQESASSERTSENAQAAQATVAPKKRKRKKIRKADGPDGFADPAGRDSYLAERGFVHWRLSARIKKSPSVAVTRFCRLIAKSNPPGLSPSNRWVFLRTPNAFRWLDENRRFISEDVMNQCFASLAADGLMI